MQIRSYHISIENNVADVWFVLHGLNYGHSSIGTNFVKAQVQNLQLLVSIHQSLAQ